MAEKVFRVVSNDKEYLSADTIAMALLKQITLNSREPNIFFGVTELEGKSQKKYAREYTVVEEDNL